MGLYDPTFTRRPFVVTIRQGEVPGSVVFGKAKSKGCVWPGSNGKWFAAFPDHDPAQPYPSFDTKDAATAYITAPLEDNHRRREDDRERAWMNAAPKREARAAKCREREEKRLGRKLRKDEHVWRVLDASGAEIGRVVRSFEHEARVAAASLLGFSILPPGHKIEKIEAVD